MTRKTLSLLTVIFTILLAPVKSLAFCPICTVAVGAGVGLSRYLRIDDTVTGIWIGAFLVSSIMWLLNYLEKRKVTSSVLRAVIALGLYAATATPLYYYDIIGHPQNRIWGFDKLLFGIIVGTILFLLAVELHKLIKSKKGGKVFFSFQKIVVPLIILSIASLVMFKITR